MSGWVGGREGGRREGGREGGRKGGEEGGILGITEMHVPQNEACMENLREALTTNKRMDKRGLEEHEITDHICNLW